MFGPVYGAGCTVCSSIADNIDPNVAHLKARDVTMMLVSRAPLEKLQAYKKRMGWDIDWALTAGSDFNRDLGFASSPQGLNPFLHDEIPPAAEQLADRPGATPGGYVGEGAGRSAYLLSDGHRYRSGG